VSPKVGWHKLYLHAGHVLYTGGPISKHTMELPSFGCLIHAVATSSNCDGWKSLLPKVSLETLIIINSKTAKPYTASKPTNRTHTLE